MDEVLSRYVPLRRQVEHRYEEIIANLKEDERCPSVSQWTSREEIGDEMETFSGDPPSMTFSVNTDPTVLRDRLLASKN